MRLKIYNGQVIAPNGILKNGSLLIDGGKIIEVSGLNIYAPNAVELDAKGNYISPGFIDIHIHGGGGHDQFCDGLHTLPLLGWVWPGGPACCADGLAVP